MFENLFLTEALCLLNGVSEFLHQLIITLVGRKVQSVEACVRPGQPGVLPNLLNTESLRTVASHQLSESSNRNATRATHKLK